MRLIFLTEKCKTVVSSRHRTREGCLQGLLQCKIFNSAFGSCVWLFTAVNWKLVTFIKSKTNYFKRRELLRRTWNSVSYINGARLEAIYLMGQATDAATKALLDEEEERYGDILQYDGPDDYE